MSVDVQSVGALLDVRREQIAAEADALEHAAAVVTRLAEGRVADVLRPMLAAAEQKLADAEAEAATRRASVEAAQGRLDAAEAALAAGEAAQADALPVEHDPRSARGPARDTCAELRQAVTYAQRDLAQSRDDPRFGLATLEDMAARARARRDAIARAVELSERGPLLPVLAAAVERRRSELAVVRERRAEVQARLDGIEAEAAADHAAAVAALVEGSDGASAPAVSRADAEAGVLREAVERLDARVADAEAALLLARAEAEEAEGQVVGGVIAALERAHRTAYDDFVAWTERLRAETPAPVNRARPAAREHGWRPSPLHDVVAAALNGHAGV